jgi:putative transposase
MTSKSTAVRSSNMNAYAERFVRSIRQEALDHFILISEKQIKKIVEEYVNYYNKYRPHQGIGDIPDKCLISGSGNIQYDDVLFGLHHHYYRSSA